jgi:hypothetical protein
MTPNEQDTLPASRLAEQDTLPAMTPFEQYFFADDSVAVAGQGINGMEILAGAENFPPVQDKEKPPFKPNPKKAPVIAVIFPGLGQIYNRQYWKLPIVYGGAVGCAYAVSWNNRTFQDYKNAYFSILADAEADPKGEHPENWSDSWQAFVQGGVDPATRLHNSQFHQTLKRGKDNYRRYRDLSIIISVAIYGIIVADAYVDAQMFDFDISPDLSFQVTPEIMPGTFYHSRSYGINFCMNF